jgi:hypothetical protein
VKRAPQAGFDEGGETACWMHLLCPECGAVLSDDEAHACGEVVDSVATSDRSPDQSV